jgi:fatty-acyl-CoA synthase
VRAPGHAIGNDDLAAFCRGKLASFKIPRYTLVLDAFPMTPSGKAQKFKLREMVAQALASGAL